MSSPFVFHFPDGGPYEPDDIGFYELWIALQDAMWSQWYLYPSPLASKDADAKDSPPLHRE